MTNLYNFMDGSDGLAGGMAVIGFAAYALAAWLAGMLRSPRCASPSRRGGGVSAAQLHPARVFLGDVGSIPLGFLAAALGIVGWRDDLAAVVPGARVRAVHRRCDRHAGARLMRGERVWQAHREHYYQRMVRMGLGHRAPRGSATRVMAVCAGRGASWPQPGARAAGARVRRRERAARQRRRVGRPALGALRARGKAREPAPVIVFAARRGRRRAGLDRRVLAALQLRYAAGVPAVMLELLPWVLGIYAASFLGSGLYRGLWRYASLPDLQRIAVAVGIGRSPCRPASLSCASGTGAAHRLRAHAAAADARDGRKPPRLPRWREGRLGPADRQAAGDAGAGARRRATRRRCCASSPRAGSGAWSACSTTTRASTAPRSPA